MCNKAKLFYSDARIWGGGVQNYIWENILNYFEIKELDIGRSPSIEWSKFVTSETEWILFSL